VTLYSQSDVLSSTEAQDALWIL